MIAYRYTGHDGEYLQAGIPARNLRDDELAEIAARVNLSEAELTARLEASTIYRAATGTDKDTPSKAARASKPKAPAAHKANADAAPGPESSDAPAEPMEPAPPPAEEPTDWGMGPADEMPAPEPKKP